jgi:hypothetical protein
MNDISKNSLFFPKGVNIDIENTQRPSDVKAVKWKKTTEVHDQVFFLNAGILASRNTSKIIGHHWK